MKTEIFSVVLQVAALVLAIIATIHHW